MAKTQHVCLDEVVGYFDELEDPRSTVNQKHPLVSVVVIAMMAVLAGAGGPTAIAKWAKLKAEFLMRVLELPNGIPRKDVFRRVLCLLKARRSHRASTYKCTRRGHFVRVKIAFLAIFPKITRAVSLLRAEFIPFFVHLTGQPTLVGGSRRMPRRLVPVAQQDHVH